MTESDLLISILTKFYNKTEQEVRDLIYAEDKKTLHENAFENISTIDAARVGKFKTDAQTTGKNMYAKAKEEERKKAALQVKETFGIETDSDVLDDVLSVGKEQIEEKTKKKKEPLTEEQVKQHPLFIAKEKELKKIKDESIPKSEHDAFVAKIEEDKIFSQFNQLALQGRAKLMADVDAYKDVPEVAHNIEQAYLNSFREYQLKSDGNGGFIVLKNGERVNDAHGNPITPDDLIKVNVPKFYKLLKQTPKGSTGNEPAAGGGQDGKQLNFKTKKDYTDYINSLDKKDKEYDKKEVEAFSIYKKAVQEGIITE